MVNLRSLAEARPESGDRSHRFAPGGWPRLREAHSSQWWTAGASGVSLCAWPRSPAGQTSTALPLRGPMVRTRRTFRPLLTAALAFSVAPTLGAQAARKPTIEQFISPASPLELASAKKVDRLAWPVFEKGMRNVYTAAAPDFTPVRLTRFLEDNGI